ncbi:site-2 protease family protein [Intestinibacillus massiliensis]|nr:site-2 protease family protein [Intestinibacillus massiliensis]
MLFRLLSSGNLNSAIIGLVLSLPAILLCLSVHETCHGLAAYALGDRTARDEGRLSLNPLAHIDPMGFLCMVLFGFGWAKPVPVNITRFKNRRAGMAVTALAGPLSNFILAFIMYALYLVMGRAILGPEITSLGPVGPALLLSLLMSGQLGLGGLQVFLLVVLTFIGYSAILSVGLGVFNLIPVYPLDGSRILDALLPYKYEVRFNNFCRKYQNLIMLALIVVLWFGGLDMLISWADRGVYGLAAMLFG